MIVFVSNVPIKPPPVPDPIPEQTSGVFDGSSDLFIGAEVVVAFNGIDFDFEEF